MPFHKLFPGRHDTASPMKMGQSHCTEALPAPHVPQVPWPNKTEEDPNNLHNTVQCLDGYFLTVVSTPTHSESPTTLPVTNPDTKTFSTPHLFESVSSMPVVPYITPLVQALLSFPMYLNPIMFHRDLKNIIS